MILTLKKPTSNQLNFIILTLIHPVQQKNVSQISQSKSILFRAYNILSDKTKKKYYDDLGLGQEQQEIYTYKKESEKGLYSKEFPKEDKFLFENLPPEFERLIKSYEKIMGATPTTKKAIINQIYDKKDVIV